MVTVEQALLGAARLWIKEHGGGVVLAERAAWEAAWEAGLRPGVRR